MSVETGITNLAITEAVSAEGFFYAPDPSSQLACTLGGNLAMNSGGAHCLKYGVTTNNVLGLRMVLMNGEIVEIGGPYPRRGGLRLPGAHRRLGGPVRHHHRSDRAHPAEGGKRAADPARLYSSAAAGSCVAAIIASGIIPVAIEFMDKPAIAVAEAYAKAGYPLDVEALLIVEVEGSPEEVNRLLADIVEIAKASSRRSSRPSTSPEHSAKIWKGRKAAFGAIGRISDYYCMDGTIPLSKMPEVLGKISQICAEAGLKVANVFHAGDGNLHPLILYNANNEDESRRAELAGAEILKLCVAVGGCLTGEHGVGIEKRDLMGVQFSPADLSRADAHQERVRPAVAPERRQGVPARGGGRPESSAHSTHRAA